MKNEKEIEELAINIDMINGFVKEGALAAPSIMRIVPRQIKLLEDYSKDNNKAIAFIKDEHSKNAVEFKTFGPHCIKGTKECDVIDELKIYYDTAYHFTKNSTNFVFANGFQEQIERLKNLKKVLLMGCLSDICVKNGGITLRNYFDELNHDIDIYVAEGAIDTYDNLWHNADEVTYKSIEDMITNGIKVYSEYKDYNKKEEQYLNIVKDVLEEKGIYYFSFDKEKKGDETVCINKINPNKYKVFDFERNCEYRTKYYDLLNEAVKELISRLTDSYEKEQNIDETIERRLKKC